MSGLSPVEALSASRVSLMLLMASSFFQANDDRSVRLTGPAGIDVAIDQFFGIAAVMAAAGAGSAREQGNISIGF